MLIVFLVMSSETLQFYLLIRAGNFEIKLKHKDLRVHFTFYGLIWWILENNKRSKKIGLKCDGINQNGREPIN